MGGDAKLAEAFAARGELLEFAKGSQLISAPEIRDWAARLEAGWPSAFRAACPHSAVRSATDNRGLG